LAVRASGACRDDDRFELPPAFGAAIASATNPITLFALTGLVVCRVFDQADEVDGIAFVSRGLVASASASVALRRFRAVDVGAAADRVADRVIA